MKKALSKLDENYKITISWEIKFFQLFDPLYLKMERVIENRLTNQLKPPIKWDKIQISHILQTCLSMKDMTMKIDDYAKIAIFFHWQSYNRYYVLQKYVM